MLKDRIYKFVSPKGNEFKSIIWIYGGWKTIGVFNSREVAALSRLETLRFFHLIKLKNYKVWKRKIKSKIPEDIDIKISLDKNGKKLKIKSKII